MLARTKLPPAIGNFLRFPILSSSYPTSSFINRKLLSGDRILERRNPRLIMFDGLTLTGLVVQRRESLGKFFDNGFVSIRLIPFQSFNSIIALIILLSKWINRLCSTCRQTANFRAVKVQLKMLRSDTMMEILVFKILQIGNNILSGKFPIST